MLKKIFTTNLAALAALALSYAPVFAACVAITYTVQRTWVATPTSQDYGFFAPAGSAFTAAQVAWAAYDMAVGDVFNSEASTRSDGFLRMRTITGPLQVGSGGVKGSPAVTWGDHFDQKPAVRPLGDGVWSNAITELKASVGGTRTSGTTGGYARALQIHGFRTAYTGSDWLGQGTTRGQTYDIQVAYRKAGDYPDPRVAFGGWLTPYSRVKLGDHTWDFIRWDGGWDSDLGFSYHLVDAANPGTVPTDESISNVDMKAILDHALADANARLSRNDTGIYVRGVQAWSEPRNGAMDITTEGMTVRYNGTTYGVPFQN